MPQGYFLPAAPIPPSRGATPGTPGARDGRPPAGRQASHPPSSRAPATFLHRPAAPALPLPPGAGATSTSPGRRNPKQCRLLRPLPPPAQAPTPRRCRLHLPRHGQSPLPTPRPRPRPHPVERLTLAAARGLGRGALHPRPRPHPVERLTLAATGMQLEDLDVYPAPYEVRSLLLPPNPMAAWGGGCCARARPVTGGIPSDCILSRGI